MQSNWSYSTNESHWKTISSSRAGYQEFDDLKVALRVFQANANMARCIAPMRVIDSEGVIYADYNPERDTRLPGPRHRLIQRAAYDLWNSSAKDKEATEFWDMAEKNLVESNGVTINEATHNV